MSAVLYCVIGSLRYVLACALQCCMLSVRPQLLSAPATCLMHFAICACSSRVSLTKYLDKKWSKAAQSAPLALWSGNALAQSLRRCTPSQSFGCQERPEVQLPQAAQPYTPPATISVRPTQSMHRGETTGHTFASSRSACVSTSSPTMSIIVNRAALQASAERKGTPASLPRRNSLCAVSTCLSRRFIQDFASSCPMMVSSS